MVGPDITSTDSRENTLYRSHLGGGSGRRRRKVRTTYVLANLPHKLSGNKRQRVHEANESV
jgi:hypothetical protein